LTENTLCKKITCVNVALDKIIDIIFNMALDIDV